MTPSWIAGHPQWYRSERELMARRYPGFTVDEERLERGQLAFYGELAVRPPGGTVRYPVMLLYPDATPFEMPVVMPLVSMPTHDGGEGTRAAADPEPRFFDYRHQMPSGAICLFQKDARDVASGGDVVRGVDALRRAERWFQGTHTGHWPPDSADSELEMHFEGAGSVLLGSAFYEGIPAGPSPMHGEFYLVPDLRRSYEDDRRYAYPYVATALTANVNGVLHTVDARSDLARLYPWIRGGAWEPFGIATSTDLTPIQEAHGIERGHWWYLPEEPQPFRDGVGFLRELSRAFSDDSVSQSLEATWNAVQGALRAELVTSNKHFLGLCFPGRNGGIDWLMLVCFRNDNLRKDGSGIVIQTSQEKRIAFEKSHIFVLRAHSLRPGELSLRNQGVVGGDVVGKTVALMGVGALGSKVAEMLAQAGVGAFRICDLDVMSTGNAARHVSGVSSFGSPKVKAMVRRLLEINPHLRFEEGAVWFGSATTSRQELASFIAPADLVVSTMADESAEAVLNEVALSAGKPVLYGRALRRGSVGRIFIVRPGRDACKACLANYARDSLRGTATPDDWINVIESPDDAVLHECGRPVIPASAVDLSFVAGITARVALEFLEGKGVGARLEPDSTNHWIWTRDVADEVDARLNRSLSTFAGTVPPYPLCPSCRPCPVTSVILSDEIMREISRLTEDSHDRETGGVLIGYREVETGRLVVKRTTGPGPNAIRTETRFLRDIEFVQSELDTASVELGNEGEYVGEWHSHLVAEPYPSAIDIGSLTGIAESENYPTLCPIMVIAGLDTGLREVAKVAAWAFPAGSRMVPLPLESSNSLPPNI